MSIKKHTLKEKELYSDAISGMINYITFSEGNINASICHVDDNEEKHDIQLRVSLSNHDEFLKLRSNRCCSIENWHDEVCLKVEFRSPYNNQDCFTVFLNHTIGDFAVGATTDTTLFYRVFGFKYDETKAPNYNLLRFEDVLVKTVLTMEYGRCRVQERNFTCGRYIKGIRRNPIGSYCTSLNKEHVRTISEKVYRVAIKYP